MQSKILRAGIIGLGVGEQHIFGYNSHPNCKTTAVCDFNKNKLESIKQKYPYLKYYNNAEELLNDKKIDVVSIASFDNFHYEQILLAIKNNKHIFVEKPLCIYKSQAGQIWKELENNKHIKLSSNLILRKSPRFVDLKKRINNNEFGDIFSIEGDYNYGRIHKIIDGWRGNIEFYSIVYGGGVHIVDLIMWLKQNKITNVVSFANNICTKNTNFKYNDFNTSLLRFEDSSIAKVTCNFGCMCSHFHELRIYGTKATFINYRDKGVIIRSRDIPEDRLDLNTEYPGYKKGDIIYSFIDSIIDNTKEADISKKEVFDAMSVCFAIEESAKSNKTVNVDYYN